MDYDLEERAALFGENIIKFCKKILLNNINKPLINQ
ncbi:four helix bundle protein, partial [Candidatus Falkowbacteria bacterium CG_4_8_14_3_um_filter_36_11]